VFIIISLIKKEIPITEPIPEKSKKGFYSISDNFLRFYFTFIFPNKSTIEEQNFTRFF
jgi:hypothetical protein